MKKLAMLIISILYFTISGFSQTTDSSATLPMPYDSTQVFTKVDTDAVCPTWIKYIMHTLNPSVASDHGAPVGTYKVIIQFIVARDGSITNVEAMTNFGYGMEAEAIRVVQNGPKWKPAKQNGHYVNAYRVQPVTFKVE